MKIDRLIGILSVLLQEEKVTAPELAEKFEVSRRTINRDIEDLCKAGIPICTLQGVGGGISIENGYKMDRTILSSKDMQMIMAGLRSLDSVSGNNYYGQLMEKIKVGSSKFVNGKESILIDLAAWSKERVSTKIESILDAIDLKKELCFKYYSPNGEMVRNIEPYYLIFKWSSWYVYGFCKDRKAFRMFKLSRMDALEHGEYIEENRTVPAPDLSNDAVFPENLHVKAIFDASMKWHVIEEFGNDSFFEQKDGKLLFEHDFTGKDNLLSWMLSCQDKVELLEPVEIRDELKKIVKSIIRKYEE